MIIKDTNKRDIEFKEVYVKNGKFYDEGIEVDLISILEKAYANSCPFNLSITAKTEEEIDLPDSEYSDDE